MGLGASFGRVFGPKLWPSWAYVEQVSLKRWFKTPFEKMLLPNIIFLARVGSPWTPRDTKNRAKPLEGIQNSRFSPFQHKLFWGCLLGPLLERFWSPSWSQVGPSWHQVGPSWPQVGLLWPSWDVLHFYIDFYWFLMDLGPPKSGVGGTKLDLWGYSKTSLSQINLEKALGKRHFGHYGVN